MAKRIISFLLAMVMVLGLLPAQTAAAEETETANPLYTKNIQIFWMESGEELEWSVHYDYDLSQEFVSSTYPAGVSYEDGILTLENADLVRVNIQNWGDTPFQLIIKGETTITADSGSALNINSCHDMTITGGGTLTTSSPESTIRLRDVIPSEDGSYAVKEDGLLTISDVTIHSVNTGDTDSMTEDNSWNYCSMNLYGNVKMENASVSAWGYGGLIQTGDLTITGSALELSGLNIYPLNKYDGDDSRGFYYSDALIEDSSVKVSAYGYGDSWSYSLFSVGPGTGLTIGQGADITVDATGCGTNISPLAVYNDYLGAGWNGSLYMAGGSLDITAAPGMSRGIMIGSFWEQTGGDVTLRMSSGEAGATHGDFCAAIEVSSDGIYTQSGGTMTITNSLDDSAERIDEIIGLWTGRNSSVTLSGGTLSCSGVLRQGIWPQGQLLVTGGTLEVDTQGTSLDIDSRGSVSLVGGTTNITTSDADGYAIALWGNSSLRLFGGELNVQSPGFGVLVYQGFVRFDGGAANISARHALYANNASSSPIVFGEGINALDSNGTLWALEYDGNNNCGIYTDSVPITIARQGAPAAENRLMLECQQPNSVMTGLAVPMRLAASLTSPSGTVHISLPEGGTFVENSVYRGTTPVSAAVSGDGFDVEVNSGDVVTFSFIPAAAGNCTVSASFGGTSEAVTLNCRDYTLSIPSAVNQNTIPLSGTSVAGSTLTFYADSQPVGSATASGVGTWSTTLTLPDEEGIYSIYAVITAADGTRIAVSDVYRVTYLKSGAAVKTLTISNWIHGNTELDPDQQTSVVIDYENGTRSANYYTYWPELPEFTFEVRFQGDSGSDQRVSDVTVVATDWQGVQDEVPLSYDAASGVWTGTHDFCNGENIVPDSFRVEWMPLTDAVSEPDDTLDTEFEETETDSTTSAVLFLESGGPVSIPVSADFQLESLTDGLGDPVTSALGDSTLTFTAQAGESYFVVLSAGSFTDYPEHTRLTVLAGGSAGEDVVEYLDGVIQVDSSAFTDMTDSTFVSSTAYTVGDVLVVDGTYAIAVTAAEGTCYTYETATLDQVYRHLDVSSIDTSQPLTVDWGQSESAIAAELRQSELYSAYTMAVEAAAAEFSQTSALKFQIGETTASVELEYGWKDGGVHVAPAIVLETEMTTKLPGSSQEISTTVTGKLTITIDEKIQYRARSMQEDKVLQSYMLSTDETVGYKLEVSASVGDSGDSPDIEEYFFEGLDASVTEKFLEELKSKEDENTLPILEDLVIDIPIPVPALTLSISPTIELNWNFFGELSTSVEVTTGSKRGVTLSHIGDNYLGGLVDWSVETFCEKKDPQFTASLGLHASASTGLEYGCEIGLGIAKSVDLALYGKAGPKFTLQGHGTAQFNGTSSPDLEAELSAVLSLEAEYGVTVGIRLLSKFLNIPGVEYPLYSASTPLAQWGGKVMPTRFAQVEENPVIVSDTASLSGDIDLALQAQVFSADGSIRTEEKQFDAEDYTFELADTSIPATLTSDGQLTITDTSQELSFQVKVTYTGSSSDYTLWKLVPVKYTPSSIQILKTTEENGPRSASFLVVDLDNAEDTGTTYSTYDDGSVLFEAVPGHRYVVLETAWPGGYYPAASRQEIVAGNESQTISFTNLKVKEKEKKKTPDIVTTGSGDPSGYVYEGIESNRLAGVTATLYQASDENGSNATVWNAEAFDQQNPLTTDALGQYLWMVPSGWWQVRYEKEGYTSAASDWMVVPPIRTNVNQNLTSTLPASIETMAYSEEAGTVMVKFSRPVILSSVSDYSVTIGGAETGAQFSPVDADWSVMEDPADSRPCATTFLLWAEPELRGQTVAVTFTSIETYNGVVSENVSASTDVAQIPSYSLSVNGGTGSGTYQAGTSVTVSAVEKKCYPFDHWEANGVTLADAKAATITFAMPGNDAALTAVYSEIPVHDFEETITAPTCTEGGYTTYVCKTCDHTQTDDETAALGHTEVIDEGVPASCTETGLTEGKHCSACGAVLQKQETVPAIGHEYGDWETAIAATGTSQGLEAQTCIHCGDMQTRTLPKLSNPFTDVAEADYFFDPVLWAVSKDITKGMTETTFSPELDCTRGQIVTFLWRANGSPEPASDRNPFTDVSSDDYFYKAVLWAVDKGITTGTSTTTFSPEDSCTRGQAATFLWRAQGSPVPASARNPFTDVSSADYFYNAVLWAVENGVTNGISTTTFSPELNCTRGQIVTFLYRAMA